MHFVITAVGPDHAGLVDPIVHFITAQGANIAEIQMYDHDEEAVFAMFCRISLEDDEGDLLQRGLEEIGRLKRLSIRVWSPERNAARPRLAICTTYRKTPAVALLQAMSDGQIQAEPALMIGNRDNCRSVAEQFDVPWQGIGNEKGVPDEEKMVQWLDDYQIDYVILARYMRVLPASTCWRFAGGRIINLHHGLLPSFPGMRPYHDAHSSRMLTYGATCHFIVPELDAGNQIIHQATYTVPPGMKLNEIIRLGEEENEPGCLVEGVRRVVDREVQLHFHRVVAREHIEHRVESVESRA